MKNKLKTIVLLAILLTLALLAFTGCTTTNRRYNVDDIGSVTISDAVEDSLSSCVAIKVSAVKLLTLTRYEYYCVGVAVSENEIILPYQAMPNMSENRNVTYKGRMVGDDTNLEFRLTEIYPDYAFIKLRLNTSNVKLKPVIFANSDNLLLGELLFGVEFSKSYKIGIQSMDAIDYLRLNSVMVSSKAMMKNSSCSLSSEILEQSTFTAQAYAVVSEPSYSHNFSVNLNGASVVEYSLINNIVFNQSGEFVGLNYLKKVDSSDNNEHVVDGITYVVKSNAIKQALNN